MTVSADTSAISFIQSYLDQFGLSALGQWAWDQLNAGVPQEQLLLQIPQQQAFKDRFPAYEELQKRGQAMSPAQIVQFEHTIAALNSQYGIPQGAWSDRQGITALLLGDVSPTEYEKRLQMYSADAYNAPPEARAAMRDYYGVQGQGNLAAYYADPKNAEPELERQFNAAMIGGQSQISGFGPLSRAQAENLADLGVNQSAARQGFTSLASLGDVVNTQREGEQSLTQDQLLAAQFGGDAAVQQQIRDRQARRLAEFQAGGQYAQGQGGGFAGIGVAGR
jgi:hypothetical protein